MIPVREFLLPEKPTRSSRKHENPGAAVTPLTDATFADSTLDEARAGPVARVRHTTTTARDLPYRRPPLAARDRRGRGVGRGMSATITNVLHARSVPF